MAKKYKTRKGRPQTIKPQEEKTSMTLDRNHMSTPMKVVVVIFGVALVLSMCLPFFSTCSTPADDAQKAAEEQAQATSEQQSETAAEIDAAHEPLVERFTSKLDEDPANLSALANMGNAYLQWGADLANASDAADEAAVEHRKDIYSQAITYYDRYLEISESDVVELHRLEARYYSGEEEEAIDAAEAMVADKPDFSPAWYDLGCWRLTAGDSDGATEAFNTCIDVESGQEASYGMANSASYQLKIMDYMRQIQEQIDAAAEAAASDDDETAGDSGTSDTTASTGAAASDDADDATAADATADDDADKATDAGSATDASGIDATAPRA